MNPSFGCFMHHPQIAPPIIFLSINFLSKILASDSLLAAARVYER